VSSVVNLSVTDSLLTFSIVFDVLLFDNVFESEDVAVLGISKMNGLVSVKVPSVDFLPVVNTLFNIL
jgi:hypothetical protein